MQMIDVANKLVEARKMLDEEMKPLIEMLKDTSRPLDERWEAHVALVEGNVLNDIQNYGDGFIEILGNYTLYDDFFMDRHEKADFINILERVEDEWFEGEKPEPENVIKWKEQVLATGMAGFEHDW